MKTVNVTLSHHTYPLYLGHDIAFNVHSLKKHIAADQVMIVSNTTLEALYVKPLVAALSADYQCDVVLLPDGEEYKTWQSLNLIFDALLAKKHRRNTTLIALGGGVVGDITGFAAASYQRGVPFIQIPTSLLAQVDASIGGKTGINHPLGKNMIGAFYQPQAVFIDIAFLKTLPPRHFYAGLAEIIKHALIQDAAFFHQLENNIDAIIAKDTSILIDAIYKSCLIKAHIVEQDEKEQKNIRALLNFGHTFAHAIESATHYTRYLHGEAVAIGMVLAAERSVELGYLALQDVTRIVTLLARAHLPTALPADLTRATLEPYMQRDKKNREANHITYVLLDKIGHAILV